MTATAQAPGDTLPTPPRWRRAPVVLAAAVVLTLVLVGYRFVPDVRGLGSLIDSGAPWLGLGVPVLFVAALVRRSPAALAAALVPALVWMLQFGVDWLPNGRAGPAQLTVASQNLYANNPDPLASVRELTANGADLVGVQEAADGVIDRIGVALSDRYPHVAAASTIALYSRFPIEDRQTVDTGLGWARALRAQVATPQGPVTVYVVHLASARIGKMGMRDRSLAQLADRLRVDKAPRLIVMGDFNTATTDRAFRSLDGLVQDSQRVAGTGPGFTWPAEFPLTRPDHVLFRGVRAVDSTSVRTPGTDHRGITAGFRLQ